MAKILKVEIEGVLIQKNTAAETYIDTFNLLYKKGLIKESILSDFNFVKENKTDFSPSAQRLNSMLFLIDGSKNLWMSTYSSTDTKYADIKEVFDRYKISGTVGIIEKNPQQKSYATEKENTNAGENEVEIIEMKWVDAIRKALFDLDGKGTEPEILEIIERNGYRTFDRAKTPNRSLNYYFNQKMHDEVAKQGKYWCLKNYQNQSEIANTVEFDNAKQTKADHKKHVDNILKQAICVIGDSGVGKSVRIKKTLEKAGHEKLIIIIDSLWAHLLFDYIPESRKYELTKIGEFIREANDNKTKLYTVVIDECHKNLEIVNDSLLQAISTNRNEGKRFLSLNTFGDKLFAFLPKEDGNRILPGNLGFVFISSKKDVIIEGNPDLKNRVEIIELTKDDWQDESYTIQYLLEKIKKEEQSEYTN